MEKSKDNNKIDFIIPSVSQLEGRFLFIDDKVLRGNLARTFQYIHLLIHLEDDLEEKELKSSIHKDMILHTAIIIESCLHYCLGKAFFLDLCKEDVMPFDWIVTTEHVTHDISDIEKIIGLKMKKERHKYGRQTNFIVINRVAKQVGILDEPLFKKSEELREMRNRIHLGGLISIEDYQKKDSENAFKTAKKIIERIEFIIHNRSL